MATIPPQIDTSTYNVAVHHPVGQGYDRRPGNRDPISIVMHSTNNRKKTTFDSEGDWLRDAGSVSATYLVGEDGRIALTCPEELRPWHAGAVLDQTFNNANSIGIELHISVGGRPTAAMLVSVTWLVEDIMRRRRIPRHLIETHRKVATPHGRKSDPEGWSDRDFYLWRSNLAMGVLVGQHIIDPRIHPSWQLSGGVWKPNQATPGFPIGPAFVWQGKTCQLFERVGARVEDNGLVQWMLVDEYLACREALRTLTA